MTAFEGPRVSAIMILIVGIRQSPSPRENLGKRGGTPGNVSSEQGIGVSYGNNTSRKESTI